MIVDLKDKENKGTFELPGGGKVHLRLRTEEDEKAIRAASIKKEVEYPLLDGKYQRFEVEKVDADLFFEMGMDCNIAGWDGLFDRDNNPIPVTKENKVLLMKNVSLFQQAVNDGLKILKEREKEEAEATEKN